MTQDARLPVERIAEKIIAGTDPLRAAFDIINEQDDLIYELELQHRDLVLRNRLLRERPDLPMERLVAYQDVVALFDEQALELATLRARLRALGLDEEAVHENGR